MSTAVAEPPAPTQAPVIPAGPHVSGSSTVPLKGLHEAAAAHHAEEASKRGPRPAQEVKVETVKEAPKVEAKPEPAKTEEKPEVKRSIDALKPKEDVKVEAKAEVKVDPDAPSKEQSRWMELRAAEKELQEIKPKWGESAKKIEEYEQKLKAVEEERRELTELRSMRDMTDITRNPGYQQEVEVPYQGIFRKASEIAEYAGIDVQALMDVLKDTNTLRRGKAVETLLEGAKETVPSAAISALVSEADKLEGIQQKYHEYHEKAAQLREQHENAKKADEFKAKTEAEEVIKRAHAEVHGIFKARVSDVLDEATLKQAMESAAASKSDDPMDRAYRHQAEFLVPSLIAKVRSLTAEIAAHKQEQQEVIAAKPKVVQQAPKEPGRQFAYTNISEAVQAHREAGQPL